VAIENGFLWLAFSPDTDSKGRIICFHKMTSVAQLIQGQDKCCGLRRRHVIIIYYQQFIKYMQVFIAPYL